MQTFKPIMIMLMLAGVLLPLQAVGKSSYQSSQEAADKLYTNKNYKEALRQYLRLAKKGDHFSQYRVSYMYLEGQGHEEDIVEAFAWAYLAAQTRQDELLDYRDTVSQLVPADKQNKAMRKLDYYMRKWADRELASVMITQTKRELHECTGSRLGTRCEEVYAAKMPRFWGVNPGSGNEAESVGGSNTASGSRSSVIGNEPGGPSRDVAYYQGLRDRINVLNQYIGENTGNVQLGELQVVDEEPNSNSDNR